jgi:LPXTG-motif cell wall-anchored protein
MAMTENTGGGRGPLVVVIGLVLLGLALYFGSR